MSVTSHLKDRTSPIRMLLDELFPTLEHLKQGRPLWKEMQHSWGIESIPHELKTGVVTPSAHRWMVGTAFDYRARFLLGRPDVTRLVAASGAALLQRDGRLQVGNTTLQVPELFRGRRAPSGKQPRRLHWPRRSSPRSRIC